VGSRADGGNWLITWVVIQGDGGTRGGPSGPIFHPEPESQAAALAQLVHVSTQHRHAYFEHLFLEVPSLGHYFNSLWSLQLRKENVPHRLVSQASWPGTGSSPGKVGNTLWDLG
jgi:hypothetical protein